VALGQLGDPSSDVRLAVGVAEPPSAPADLLGMVDGTSVALSWRQTFSGGVPTGVSLVVTGALETTVALGMAETFRFDGVPGGTYTFAVVATNAAGVSPPSNAVTLAFPGACSGPPEAPARLVLQRSGRTLTAGWDPPAQGPAVTGYRVDITGSFTRTITTVSRILSGVVAPGTYTVHVAATNACGTGPAGAAQTVVVP
jgi:hypothetical protein